MPEVSPETKHVESIDSTDSHLLKSISDLRSDLDAIGIDVSQVPPESLIEMSLWLVSSMANDPEDRKHPAFESFIVDPFELILNPDQLAGLACVDCSESTDEMKPVEGVGGLFHCVGCQPPAIKSLKTAIQIARPQ